jgi:hypothetical protein
MPSSVFKREVPREIVGGFLRASCYTDAHERAVVDRNAYKKSILQGTLFPFLSSLVAYYHQSTQFYLTRKMTYTRFLTILRQLFRHHEMAYDIKTTHTSTKKEVAYTIMKGVTAET